MFSTAVKNLVRGHRMSTNMKTVLRFDLDDVDNRIWNALLVSLSPKVNAGTFKVIFFILYFFFT